jgi:hypothetical protein
VREERVECRGGAGERGDPRAVRVHGEAFEAFAAGQVGDELFRKVVGVIVLLRVVFSAASVCGKSFDR